MEAIDRSNADISSVSFVTFNVAAIFWGGGHPYIWRSTIHHGTTVRHDTRIFEVHINIGRMLPQMFCNLRVIQFSSGVIFRPF